VHEGREKYTKTFLSISGCHFNRNIASGVFYGKNVKNVKNDNFKKLIEFYWWKSIV